MIVFFSVPYCDVITYKKTNMAQNGLYYAE